MEKFRFISDIFKTLLSIFANIKKPIKVIHDVNSYDECEYTLTNKTIRTEFICDHSEMYIRIVNTDFNHKITNLKVYDKQYGEYKIFKNGESIDNISLNVNDCVKLYIVDIDNSANVFIKYSYNNGVNYEEISII